MKPSPPEKVRTFQRTLYIKAKQVPDYRFYSLYDKVYRKDILEHSWQLCRAKRGAPGVDGETFAKIEKSSVEAWLGRLQEEVRTGAYKPAPVKRVMIPKAGGDGERPLGIPTIRDRVVQTAVKLVIEPIFDADFDEAAHGYRPRHSASGAVTEVHEALKSGQVQVVDGDLSKYFDTIPHDELMECISRRISDTRMLKLLKSWLKVLVEETTPRGGKRYTGGKKSKSGTPQGGVISPLLANIYMHRYIRAFRKHKLDKKHQAKLVNYADDFVVLSRRGAAEIYEKTDQWMSRIGLKLNPTKSRIVNAWRDSFNFLGYTFGTQYAHGSSRQYLGAGPSEKAVKSIKAKVREGLRPRNKRPEAEVISTLNRQLRGWANYFDYGRLADARRTIDHYVIHRVRNFLRRRHKVQGRGTVRYSVDVIRNQLGVVSLAALPRKRPVHASK